MTRFNPGTRVVTEDGTVGLVVESGAARTLVRFSDGSTVDLAGEALTGLASWKEGGDGPTDPFPTFEPFVIYRCVVGSRAFGLDSPDSDTDLRGIYLPPADRLFSLDGVPEQIERKESEECYWELSKFLKLALKANPNILECLYTPLVLFATPLAGELRSIRSAFLSKLLYQTYNGYVLSQFKKLDADQRLRGAYRWKHAMHLIRLLLSGITALREGYVPVRVEAHRERLLAIKAGALPFAEVDAWRLALHEEFDDAFRTTRLPDRPDVPAVDAFLIRARRGTV